MAAIISRQLMLLQESHRERHVPFCIRLGYGINLEHQNIRTPVRLGAILCVVPIAIDKLFLSQYPTIQSLDSIRTLDHSKVFFFLFGRIDAVGSPWMLLTRMNITMARATNTFILKVKRLALGFGAAVV
jgi:hypothetical protein